MLPGQDPLPAPPHPGPNLALPSSMPPALQLGLVSPQQWRVSQLMEKSSSQPFPFTLQGHSRRLLQSRVPTVEATVSIPANLGSPAGRHFTSCRAELCSNVSSQTSEQPPVSGHQVLCAFVAAAMVQPEAGDTLSCTSLSFSAQCCCERVSMLPQVVLREWL